ncbi:MAG: type I DNA topoisomerase [Hyphomonadaceae bacterium]|nr:type I DNA topoisomerase [Hyphomonadaceae bacterium]MBC6413064.1 type I DNA topoisomerase [Hyphomonadaceae bacterium]
MRNLVVVESPAKAKTIGKYLGKDYSILASFGHVRDLPSKEGSVDPDQDFAMTWAVDSKSRARIKDIEKALEGSDRLILATDPDREGEAISWHLLEELNKRKALKGKAVERVVFNAVTRQAVTGAINSPREVDMELVGAYLARRALDYLVGFNLSPVLWESKLPGARSAGRVQSVVLRLICERETEIRQFNSQEYWSVKADMACEGEADFTARLVSLDGNRLDKLTLGDEVSASTAKRAVETAELSIASVDARPLKRRPFAPFTTSTMQQDASGQLGFSATRTMQTAQKLYEGVDIGGETVGLITYMRTDGISMVGEAISEARTVIGSRYGDHYLPKSPRMFKNKARNAQEAHEAIRPTGFARRPETLKLSGDMAKLYKLIWDRAVASQMADAQIKRTTIEIADDKNTVGLRATGQVLEFDGHLKVYGSAASASDESDGLLPDVKVGEASRARKVIPEQHFTQPPPRFSEASLVKRMEELGIGRPSTYASTLKVLQDRDYVGLDKKRFVPSDEGQLVTAFLESFFARYVQYDYTADLEDRLDKVSAGDLDWKNLLREFWEQFSAAVGETKGLRITHVLDALNDALGPVVFLAGEDGKPSRSCTDCDDGELSLKVGKYGAFIGCSNHPDCKFTRSLGQNGNGAEQGTEDKTLGVDPDTGLDVFLKSGPYGPYVQLGKDKKPKRAGLPKDWSPDAIDLEKALRLLSHPRDVGNHPEDGKIIIAALGRYGPYILHEGTYVNLPTVEDMFEIGLNRAVSLLAEKRANPGRGRFSATVIKDLGKHPSTQRPIRVVDGHYGPYVKYEKVNATIPKGIRPEDVNMDMALEYIARKEARGGKKTGQKKQQQRRHPRRSGHSV